MIEGVCFARGSFENSDRLNVGDISACKNFMLFGSLNEIDKPNCEALVARLKVPRKRFAPVLNNKAVSAATMFIAISGGEDAITIIRYCSSAMNIDRFTAANATEMPKDMRG